MSLADIEAHIEIRQVLYRYCRGVDRGDRQMLKSVYHPDATDDHGAWKGRGHDFADYIVESMDGQQGASQHHITNVLIELDDDTAAVESYFIAFHPYRTVDDGEKVAFVGGRYLDRFERREGHWRIAGRKVLLDWTRADLAGQPWEAAGLFESGRRREQDASAGCLPACLLETPARPTDRFAPVAPPVKVTQYGISVTSAWHQRDTSQKKEGPAMEYFANFPAGSEIRPDLWAREKEAEGWHGICASDHLWVGATRYPHVFVAATQMACATSALKITTSFCNNLFRSPVEFAQAALSLQAASGGRFEAGLGAGWAQDEMEALGAVYPDGPTRVSRYVEALKIASALLKTGTCEFQGSHYQVDISGERRLVQIDEAPPPLIAAAGGPRAIREVTPLVDRVEIKASARATRGGELDFGIMSTVTEAEIRQNVERVRKQSREVPIGIFMLVATGDDPRVQGLKAGLGGGYLSRFIGDPPEVAAALAELGEMGIDRVQLTELTPGTHSTLAAHLL